MRCVYKCKMIGIMDVVITRIRGKPLENAGQEIRQSEIPERFAVMEVAVHRTRLGWLRVNTHVQRRRLGHAGQITGGEAGSPEVRRSILLTKMPVWKITS